MFVFQGDLLLPLQLLIFSEGEQAEEAINKKIETLNVDDVEQLKDCGSFIRV